jgi:hypothetical protein
MDVSGYRHVLVAVAHRERSPDTHWTGGWVAPVMVWMFGEEMSRAPTEIRKPISIAWPIQDTKFPNIHKPNLCPMLKISKRLDRVQVPHNRRLMMKIRYVTFYKKTSKLLRYRVYKTTFQKTSLRSNAGCKATCNPLTSIHLFLFGKFV